MTKEQGLQLSEKKKVLIVEDDEDVRDPLVMMLNTLGYETHEAEDSLAALIILEDIPNIDLLFTDVVLPGSMNGKELAQVARRRYRTLNILLTSGYPAKDLPEGHELDEEFYLLAKPYTLKELTERMKVAMEE